jgi:PAS domain-containing protein
MAQLAQAPAKSRRLKGSLGATSTIPFLNPIQRIPGDPSHKFACLRSLCDVRRYCTLARDAKGSSRTGLIVSLSFSIWNRALNQEHLSLHTSDLPSAAKSFYSGTDWYRDLIDQSRDLLCIHDLSGRLLAINPGSARRLGYTAGELLQIQMLDLIAPDFRSGFRCIP